MLVVHMRKSGGSTLQATISKLLNCPVVQAPSDSDFENLKLIAESPNVLCFIHLHPTKEAIGFVESIKTPIVILLRNPKDAFSALKRHKASNGDNFRPNGALYFRNAQSVMNEFYFNWLTFRENKHIKIIHYENLYNDFNPTVASICLHLGHLVNETDIIQQNRRYSGAPKNLQTIDLSTLPALEPTYHHPPEMTAIGHFNLLITSIFFKIFNKIK